jgi:hypothetical protein
MRMRRGSLILSAVLALVPELALAQGDAKKPIDQRAAVKDLAKRVDVMLAKPWAEAGIKPAPLATDGELYRRLSLDLIGKIPTVIDVRDFIDDLNQSGWGWLAPLSAEERFQRRYDWIERLLEMRQENQEPKFNYFARHWSAVFRTHMIPSTGNNLQAQQLLPSFEAYLRGRLEANVGFDKIAHEIITSTGSSNQALIDVDIEFRNGMRGQQATPIAFYFANENKAENLAGATARVFLGVKLECAQCHAHPFAKWTKNQFWEFAAFFAGVQPGQFRQPNAQPVNINAREIAIPGTGKTARAKFLNGAEPKFADGADSRRTLADWVVARDNPFFAKATVDQVWTYFFGYSLLEPIIEPSDDYPVTYPELLDMLAKEFTESGYDLKFLIRSIVHTEAYQRSSLGHKDANKLDHFFFSRMPVRALMPEQLYDSFVEAANLDPNRTNTSQMVNEFGQRISPRSEFVTRFKTIEKKTESSTSILQALFLMNSKFLNDRTKPETNDSITTLANQPTTTAEKIETMYLIVLSRLPRPDESARLVRYVDSGGPMRDTRRALADVYWVLLNSGEFMLNH